MVNGAAPKDKHMALPDKHPDFVLHLGEWIQMDDTFKGERAVKTKRLDYLPATEGMIQDGMTTPSAPGWKDYEAYLLRAVYRDFVKDAVKAMIGVLHEKPATFTLTPRLKDMAKNSTIAGESLQQLLRRINVQQLVKGRIGLLLDAPTGKDVNKALPYIATYDALRVINWDAGKLNEGRNTLQLVVLDESDYRREGFTWKTERKYRVLTRGVPESLESGWETPDGDADFAVAVKVNDSSTPVAADFLIPSIGGRTLSEIPFVFCNANDLVPEPETPPLLGLSNLSLAIYRAEADYRQTLYLQGQNTLVLIGVDDDDADDEGGGAPIRVGNKGVIKMKLEGDAKYIGVSASGLGEMRQSLENDRRDAALEGSQFLSGGANADKGESGEALRIRVAARTTTIKGIAITAAQALTQMLRWAAEWVGDNPDDIKVEVPSDFADSSVQGAMLLAFMQAKQLGLPLSLASLHRMMKSNDMTELSFQEENDQIEAEAETMLGTMVGPMLGQVDDNWLDEDHDPEAGPPGGTTPTTPPAGGTSPTDDPNDPGNQVSTPGQPLSGPASTAPKNKNTPVKPHGRAKGHLRGSPVPLKRKGAHKGASAGKKH